MIGEIFDRVWSEGALPGKGALAALVVTGEGRPGVFKSLTPEIARRASGH